MLRERVGQQGEAVVVPAEAVHEHERGSGRVPLGCAGRSRRGHRNGGVLPHGHGRPDPADGVRDGQGVPAGRPGRVAREHAGIGGRRGRAQQIAQADGRARGGGRRRDRHVSTLARPVWNLTDVTHASRTLLLDLRPRRPEPGDAWSWPRWRARAYRTPARPRSRGPHGRTPSPTKGPCVQHPVALRSLKIALAFVGLLVGAGFATGAEVIQYFVGFGWIGVVGAGLAGLLVTAGGAVILQLGSVFLAADHKVVFRSVSHPVMARILDVVVTVTLFAIGVVMLAGAGSTLAQQFGWPTWAGSTLMTLLVLVTGMLDVEKVSAIISLITPLVVVAVVAGFVHVLVTRDGGFTAHESLAVQATTPVDPWWLSSVNYFGLVVVMAVSMCLVIGGSITHPREAFLGGLTGGLMYTALLLMASTLLYLGYAEIGRADVPMLRLFASIAPWLGWAMVVVIYLMIYNTAIGMFYALGRRLTADHPGRYRPVFAGVTLLAFAVSFVGFGDLMNVVYPALGHLGIVLALVLLVWWLTHRRQISAESGLRLRLLALLRLREHPEKTFTAQHAVQLQEAVGDSVAAPDAVTEALEDEVAQVLEEDDALTSGGARPGPDAGPERPAGGSHSA